MKPTKGQPPKFKIKTCIRCKKDYLGHIAQKWCPACRAEKDEEDKKEVLILECPFCERIFKTTKTNKKYCTDQCKRNYHTQEYYRRKYEGQNSIG